MVRPEGIEPPAYRFEACRSIQLSYGRSDVESVAVPRGAVQGTRECAVLQSRFTSRGSFPAPSTHPRGPVAQLAEQQTLNLRVDGSIPSWLTSLRSAFSRRLSRRSAGARRRTSGSV